MNEYIHINTTRACKTKMAKPAEPPSVYIAFESTRRSISLESGICMQCCQGLLNPIRVMFALSKVVGDKSAGA